MTELFDVGPEESVLGAILNAASFSKDAGHKVCDRVVETGLLPEMFYVRSYGALFHALVVQRLAGLPLDPVSVAAWLDGNAGTAVTRGRLHVLAKLVDQESDGFDARVAHATNLTVDADVHTVAALARVERPSVDGPFYVVLSAVA